MAFTLLTQNQAQITAQNDANIYRMLSMGEDLTFIEDIKLEFSASQVGIKEGYYLVCGRLIKAENTIISIPSTKGVYRLCLRVQPSVSAIADRVKLIILDSTQSRSTTDINGDTASGIYDALLADFDTVTMRFTQRIQYAGVPLIDRVPTATNNSKGTVIAGQNLSINNQGVLNVVIPKAKANTLGGVKIGNGLSVTSDGVLSADVQEIPVASNTTLGGVKIGENIDVSSDGTISTHAPYSLPIATRGTIGGVKVGDGLFIAGDGRLNVDTSDLNIPSSSSYAGYTNHGIVKVGSNLNVYNGIIGVSENLGCNSGSRGFFDNTFEVTTDTRFFTFWFEEEFNVQANSKLAFNFVFRSMVDENNEHPVFYVRTVKDSNGEVLVSADGTMSARMFEMINKHTPILAQVAGNNEEIYILNSSAFDFTTDSSGNLYFNGKKVVLET